MGRSTRRTNNKSEKGDGLEEKRVKLVAQETKLSDLLPSQSSLIKRAFIPSQTNSNTNKIRLNGP
jgi:hypothetical protein